MGEKKFTPVVTSFMMFSFNCRLTMQTNFKLSKAERYNAAKDGREAEELQSSFTFQVRDFFKKREGMRTFPEKET